MQGLLSIWQGLPAGKKVFLVGAAAATIFAFSMLARTASTPSMTLLYAGLDARAAGDVLAALERMDVAVDVRGDAIFVPSNRRDSVRMALARDGLPGQGQAGYELLENLNGFSTTSDIFDATYWRAKEGELARTILATPGIKSARVHISRDRAGAFSRHAPQAKGVVTVTMSRGALDKGKAQSIRYLVSSAVPDLAPEQVAIIDSVRGVVLSPGKADTALMGGTDLAERETRLEADVLNLLEARVGSSNARVQVAMEIDTDREAISERVIDPAGRVVSGREVSEVSETSSGAGGSTVSVASNLPEGDTAGGANQSNSQRTQTDETLSYDLSEIRREREKMPGAIKRLSVAVLVNHIEETDAQGITQLTPRTDEELVALRELVARAVGLNEERGDTLSIQSMPFKPLVNTGAIAEKNFVGEFLERNLMSIIQIAILSVVTLILGLFVVKPLLKPVEGPAEDEFSMDAIPDMMVQDVQADDVFDENEDPMEALQSLANDKSDETALLIKSWLDEPEEAA